MAANKIAERALLPAKRRLSSRGAKPDWASRQPVWGRALFVVLVPCLLFFFCFPPRFSSSFLLSSSHLLKLTSSLLLLVPRLPIYLCLPHPSSSSLNPSALWSTPLYWELNEPSVSSCLPLESWFDRQARSDALFEQPNWTSTPKSPSHLVSSRHRIGATLPLKKPE
jgi:hypothetical protein